MAEKEIGKVVHYYDKIGVAIIELSAPLKKGDSIVIMTKTSSLKQIADSIQVEHKQVDSAKKGDSIGLKVGGLVKSGDRVFKD